MHSCSPFLLPQASAAAFQSHLSDAQGRFACCSDLPLHFIYPAQAEHYEYLSHSLSLYQINIEKLLVTH